MLAFPRQGAIALALVAALATACADDPVTPSDPVSRFPIDSPDKVIEAVERAYQTRDYDLFKPLLANNAECNAEYLFILSEATEEGETQWGYETELRAHRRMFEPQNTLPGELPVPNDLWLQSVDITLTRQADWTERTDLYSSDGGDDGLLDPTKWRAVSVVYSTDVFFSMAGEVDYQVTGQADFVVIEDLAKTGSEPGRFLLLIWEDLGAPGKTFARGV